MKTNTIVMNTYGDIFPGEDPNIYQIILSYADLCDFLDLDKQHAFRNIDDGTYMDFKAWYLDECGYHAEVKCLYGARFKAMDQIEDNHQYMKIRDYLEDDILEEQELIQITVGRPDMVMAFILRWAE